MHADLASLCSQRTMDVLIGLDLVTAREDWLNATTLTPGAESAVNATQIT